ncbi:7-deoxyloganetin glucosyltransferase-like [Typha angustifolia]|uniref:7-deoxyloganetin glucosyltransferase-like n=1 Tax=Typha angustifolia TaxID=59011 RepID=UPI003C2E69B3
MGSIPGAKPHAVCVPFPAQGHITPMLKLAKLLHSFGFHITFVNTHYNQSRLLKSNAVSSHLHLPDFHFESIPDGLPSPGEDVTQDIPSLCNSSSKHLLSPFLDLVDKLNSSLSSPPVSCIVSDGGMSFTLDAAEQLGIPDVLFWTVSACGLMSYLHYRDLVERGLTPLKDESYLTNGYLDTPVDWVPGMGNMKLKDFPSFVRTTNPEDFMLNFCIRETKRASRAAAIILNTYDELERSVLDAMASLLPPIYTVGPLSLQTTRISSTQLACINSNLWKEETECLQWLDGHEPSSVIYVNFGSITVMTNHQLIEFAFGLANSKHDFLWVIRPDLVRGDTAVLPPEFTTETKGRSLIVSWCPQEAVLSHPAIGGFLTHNGWNSTIESLSSGVAMIGWPFFAEQQTNCKFICDEWGVGMEIDNNVKRDVVEGLLRELMGGEKGKEMKRKATEWKERAVRATQHGGSSFLNLKRLVNEILLPKV